MKSSDSAGFILFTLVPWIIASKSVVKDGEIEVKLQFLEYELEDFCVSKNDAEWKFLNGSEFDLKKVRVSESKDFQAKIFSKFCSNIQQIFLDIELKESDFYKHELEMLQKHMGKKFSNKKLQRLVDLFSYPGAPLLGATEFIEYRDYTRKLIETAVTTKIQCTISENSTASELRFNSSSRSEDKCSPKNFKNINKLLFSEKNEKKLKDWWNKWFRTLEEKNRKTKYDFVQQLSILDLEAEQNGEEELSEYWLKQADITWVNYETIHDLWKEILPLYEKLKEYITSLVTQNYGNGILRSNKIIPAHVFGSFDSHDWITAVEKLGGFDGSEYFKSIQYSLKRKPVKDLYKLADNQTGELKLGHLPKSFYEKSRFHESSQTCENKIMDYCEKENVLRAMFCAGETPNLKHYIQINENVMKMKYLVLSGKEEEENGFLFREGPRESVLHEAMQSLSSLRALWPNHLENDAFIASDTHQQKNMLSLLITALHVIPPLPYYLASDIWRINALRKMDAAVSETMETTTLFFFSSTPHSTKKGEVNETFKNTDDERNSQGSHTKNGEEPKIYDTQNLTRDWWNYREQYQGIGSPDGELYEDYLQDRKIIWNKSYIRHLMQKGKSEPWQSLSEETLNISKISVKPLLDYFKPLDEVLERGIKLKNKTQLFSFDEFSLVSQGFSLNPVGKEPEGEKPEEGSDTLFFILAVIAAAGVITVIITIGRRRYRRRQRAVERKRRLVELQFMSH